MYQDIVVLHESDLPMYILNVIYQDIVVFHESDLPTCIYSNCNVYLLTILDRN